MRCEDDGLSPAPHDFRDAVPEETTRPNVHAGRRLVQKHHVGVPDQGDGSRQLSLVTPRVGARLPVRIGGQIESG